MMQRCAIQRRRLPGHGYLCLWLLAVALICPEPGHASLFKGEALDTMADVLTWIVLLIVPIIGIAVFLLIHILPEKIAEKKRHPQAKAIQCLCLLSLFFGGLLWPLAWLWAYTKPVLYKMAYGTDVDDSHGIGDQHDSEAELKRLRAQVAALEAQQARAEGGKS